MSKAVKQLTIWAVAWGCLAGCSSKNNSIADNEPQGRVEQRSVVVTDVDRAEYDAALVSLHGKVVVVDCWATWCLPCLEQLPHSLALSKEFADLAVVTLNFDGPAKAAMVEKTLLAKGGDARQTHLIAKQGASSKSMDEFEITGGALPHYKLYGTDGKLRQTFALDPTAKKQFTEEDLRAAVAQLFREAG